jgi:short-subunit dehydrogenase
MMPRQPFDLRGSRVLLTGASSGIGRELGRLLADRGARLALAARRRPLLEDLAAEIVAHGIPEPVVLETDLSRRGNALDLAREAEDALGGIDVLINNAGGGVGGAQWAVGDRDEGREAFEVNLWSPLALTAALVPKMRARGSGAVVNVTSMAHIGTWPSFGHYAATKAALVVATETLRMELVGSGVHVLHVIPGPVDTAVQGETRLIPGIERMLSRTPMGNARVMADRIVRSLEGRKNRLIYPRRTAIAWILPSLARWDGYRLAAKTARELDPEERELLSELVVRSGSMGHPMAQEAREEWERTRGRASAR